VYWLCLYSTWRVAPCTYAHIHIRPNLPIISLPTQVASIKPDNFEPKIISQTDDYLYAEFQSPTFGFIDDVRYSAPVRSESHSMSRSERRSSHTTDINVASLQVEFFFPGKNSLVEYRSASRIGESDGDINRCTYTSGPELNACLRHTHVSLILTLMAGTCRKRIRAIRQALEKKGWKSIGF